MRYIEFDNLPFARKREIVKDSYKDEKFIDFILSDYGEVNDECIEAFYESNHVCFKEA